MKKHKFSSKQQFIVTATIIGNALEWFDFTLVALMAPLITTTFLPKNSSPLLYFALIFVIAAIARPLGGLVFGYIGDKTGRKSALVKTIVMMTIPIFLIAILPTYDKIGISATIGLALILLFQGFSLGGEFPGSLVYLIESASNKTKGYVGSWSYFGIFLGMLVAGAEIYLLNTKLTLEQLQDWGWRLPFFVGGVVGIFSIFLRKLLRETPYFQKAKEFGYLVKEPIFTALHKYKKVILQGIGIVLLDTVGFNLIIIFSPTYLRDVIGLSFVDSFHVSLFTIVTLLIFTPIMGKISISVGCKRLAIWATYGLIMAAFPVFFLINLKILWCIYLGQGILALLLAAYLSNLPALVCGLFPVEVRYSAASLSINLCIGLFGALGPLIMTYFVIESRVPLLSAIYLIAGAAISLYTLLIMKPDRSHE